MDSSNTGYKHRIKALTGDASNVPFVTLDDLAYFILKLLDDSFHYMLLGEFQTDIMERDFGIYRQQSRGTTYLLIKCCLVYTYNVLNCLRNAHKKDPCCNASLDETEFFYFNSCFEISSNLTESEKSVVYSYVDLQLSKKDLLG